MRTNLFTLFIVLAVSMGACGKKAAKTTQVDNAGRSGSGGSTPRTPNNTDTDGAGSGSTPSTPYTELTCTNPVMMDDPGQKLAAFFGKTYVPTSGTGSPQSLAEEKQVIESGFDHTKGIATKVYDVESVGYCLEITGTGSQAKASLRVEYEDAIALSWYNAPVANFLTMKESGSSVSFYWFDPAGFVRLSGTLQSDGYYHADLRYVNLPTTDQVRNQLEARYRATTLHDSQCLTKSASGAWNKTAVDCVTQRLLSFNFFGLSLLSDWSFNKLTSYPTNSEITFNADHAGRWAEVLDLYVTDAQPEAFDKLLITPGFVGSMKFNRAEVTN